MGQYLGEGNHGGSEADGVRIGGGREKMFCEHPQSTWDNYFSGDKMMDLLGGNWFVSTLRYSKYWLPG